MIPQSTINWKQREINKCTNLLENTFGLRDVNRIGLLAYLKSLENDKEKKENGVL